MIFYILGLKTAMVASGSTPPKKTRFRLSQKKLTSAMTWIKNSTDKDANRGAEGVDGASLPGVRAGSEERLRCRDTANPNV